MVKPHSINIFFRLTQSRSTVVDYTHIITSHNNVFAAKLGEAANEASASQTIITVLQGKTWIVLFVFVCVLILWAFALSRYSMFHD